MSGISAAVKYCAGVGCCGGPGNRRRPALIGLLAVVSLGKAHPVRGREEHRRPCPPLGRGEHLKQVGLHRVRTIEQHRAEPVRLGHGRIRGIDATGREGNDQIPVTQLRRLIPLVLGGPVDDVLGVMQGRGLLVRYDARGILGILTGIVEGEPTDCVSDPELTLDLEADDRRVADEGDVIGEFLEIVSVQGLREIGDPEAGLEFGVSGCLCGIEFDLLKESPGLLLSERDERGERHP